MRAALIAAILALAIWASPAHATGAPELIAPVASSVHDSPLSVEYGLPDPARHGLKHHRRRAPQRD